MSLRVWLPLNGDLRNNGLDNIEVVNNGATVDNNGKIGKCYSFDGTDDKITLTNLPNPSNISVAFWMKRSANTGTRQFMFTAWNGVTCELYTSGNVHCYVAPNHGVCDSTNAITVDDGWIHVVYTFEDKVCGKLYINGSLVKTTASSNSISWNTTTGNLGYYSTYFNGKLNDFRIYDHALSAKEVKELSKGLVCHYKLDGNGANPNLVPNQGIYTQNNPYILTTNKIDGYKWLPNSYFEVEPSTTYTFSVYCDAECSPKHATDGSEPNKFSMYLYLCNDGNESKASTGGYDSAVNCNSKNNNYKNFGQRHCWTYTTTSTQKYMSIRMNNYGAGTETITHKYWYFKVEKGDKLTTYIPNINDELYSKLNYNSNIIYDTSGYGYNGIKNGNGDIITSTNTARNSLSSFFGEHNTPRIDMLDSSLFPALTSCTISWWEYSTVSSNTLIFTGIAAGGSKYIAAGSPTNRLYDSNIGTSGITMYKDGVVVSTTYSGTNVYHNNCFRTQNEWHHYCMTGVNLSSWDKFYINYYSSSFPTQAYLSDVRIYATALSAEDVKELYNTPISISNNGFIFTQGEYVEV